MNRIFESFLNRSPSITSRRRQSRGSLLSDSLQTFENRQLLTGAFLPADPAPAAAVSEVVESQGAAMPKFVSTLGDPPDADNSFGQATSLGDISGDPTDGVRVSVLGKVKARKDVEDYYSFTVSETGVYNISLSGLRRNVDMTIFQETAPDTFTPLASNIQPGIASEAFNGVLSPGTYFIRASMNDKGMTRYQINVSNFGNSLSSAFNLGTDPSPASQLVQNGRVSGNDRFDFYQFTVTPAGAGPIQVQLTGLTADADVHVLDANGVVVPDGALILPGTNNESAFVNLAAGTYFVRVSRYINDIDIALLPTDYTLTLG